MTYEQWLEHWKENYGEDTVGKYGYWRYGKHHKITVRRLTYDAMDAALAESFPHELALVF